MFTSLFCNLLNGWIKRTWNNLAPTSWQDSIFGHVCIMKLWMFSTDTFLILYGRQLRWNIWISRKLSSYKHQRKQKANREKDQKIKSTVFTWLIKSFTPKDYMCGSVRCLLERVKWTEPAPVWTSELLCTCWIQKLIAPEHKLKHHVPYPVDIFCGHFLIVLMFHPEGLVCKQQQITEPFSLGGIPVFLADLGGSGSRCKSLKLDFLILLLKLCHAVHGCSV